MNIVGFNPKTQKAPEQIMTLPRSSNFQHSQGQVKGQLKSKPLKTKAQPARWLSGWWNMKIRSIPCCRGQRLSHEDDMIVKFYQIYRWMSSVKGFTLSPKFCCTDEIIFHFHFPPWGGRGRMKMTQPFSRLAWSQVLCMQPANSRGWLTTGLRARRLLVPCQTRSPNMSHASGHSMA